MIVHHPRFNHSLDPQPDGTVLVRDLEDGRSGRFLSDGTHLSGDLLWADPQLLTWLRPSGASTVVVHGCP